MGSKFSHSTDEWSVNREDLIALFSRLSFWPTVDAFASAHNHVCDKYFSYLPQTGSAGVNFFAQMLSVTGKIFLLSAHPSCDSLLSYDCEHTRCRSITFVAGMAWGKLLALFFQWRAAKTSCSVGLIIFSTIFLHKSSNKQSVHGRSKVQNVGFAN
jgi:hypothetical protein